MLLAALWCCIYRVFAFDAGTNLHHNYQRDYDPASDRYIQRDPIVLLGRLKYTIFTKLIDLEGLRLQIYDVNSTYRKTFGQD